jgi:glycosyltransferase involved in cell wall biosynthesis
LISILIPYFGLRSQLLERTLYLLSNQTTKNKFEVWLLDDGGKVNVPSHSNFDLIVYPMPPHENKWRKPNHCLKAGYEMCNGDYVIVTSPEILPPKNALEIMEEMSDDKVMSIPMLYKLSHKQTNRMDTVDWKTSLDNLQGLENFWNEEIHPGGFPNSDAKYNYHHGGFVGAYKKVWDEIGFSPPDLDGPASDSYWHVRCGELGKEPIRLPFGVYHQWHPRKDGIPRSVRMERIYNSLV